MGYWDKKKAKAAQPKGEEGKIMSLADELKAEVLEVKRKNEEYDATGHNDTMFVLIFSCEQDKRKFCRDLNYAQDERWIDGYEFSTKHLNRPDKPSLNLPKPLDERLYLADQK